MAESRRPRVAIIGGGLAGIAAGVALKKQLKFDNFTIYEKNPNGVGGTWRDNTYPGCGSDIAIHWYSLSTHLKPDWKSYTAEQPEILQYWLDIWRINELDKKTQLGSFVKLSEWDNERKLYKMTIHDVKTGETRMEEAEILINSIGGFLAPNYPNIPGMADFKGDNFHTATWRSDVDLKGKRVGVIGNGCSAAQVIANIGREESTQLINFVRTPEWIMEHHNTRYPAWAQWMFANIPGVLRAYRNSLMFRADASFVAFRSPTSFVQRILRRVLTRYMKSKTPAKYHDKLIPKYPPGCRRIILDPGYLDVVSQPNFDFRWDAITRIDETGIQLNSGEHVDLDVLVYGTGFSLEPVDLNVKVGDKTLHDFYDEVGGAAGYLGIATPGILNSFAVLGPNVATGHASVIFSEEVQINLILQLIKPILDGKAKTVEVDRKAFDELDKWQQNRLRTSVWSACSSYYHKARDINARNVATFPGSVTQFWVMGRKPLWQHWKLDGTDETPKNSVFNSFLLFFFGLFFSFPKGW